MAKDIEIEMEVGSGNVFADIGVRDPEGSLLRAKLAKQIADIIKSRDLNQAQVAEILGVDQPKVSKLIRGHITGFTSDRLLRYLKSLDYEIETIKFRNTKRVALA